MTLYTALVTMAKLTAPFVPFMAESIYRNLVARWMPKRPSQVHLCAFPPGRSRDGRSGARGGHGRVQAVYPGGRAARNAANLKIRQPLSTVVHQIRFGALRGDGRADQTTR